jgi:hypothetical protein
MSDIWGVNLLVELFEITIVLSSVWIVTSEIRRRMSRR